MLRIRHNASVAVAPEAQGAHRLDPVVSATTERLFHEHSGWIYGYCLRMLRSPEDAEDALQATYLNAYRSLGQGVRPRGDSAWLLRIAQNVCFTRLRSSGRRARLEQLQDVTLLEETIPAPARSADELIGLTDALASLPEQQRRAILLREWQGLSYRELAESLGLSQSAVETLVFRARRSLAAALEDPAKRRRRFRAVHVLDLGGLVSAVKGFLLGSAGAKAVTAAALAVATTTTVVATDPMGIRPDRLDRSERASAPAAEVARPSAAPGASVADAGVRPAAVPTAEERLRGRDFGQAAAEKARAKSNGKAKGKANGANGQAAAEAPAQGKGKALGHAKSPGKAKSSKGNEGKGPDGTGRPEFAGATGPPPHAQGSPGKGGSKSKK